MKGRKSICIGDFEFRKTSFDIPDVKAELSRISKARLVAEDTSRTKKADGDNHTSNGPMIAEEGHPPLVAEENSVTNTGGKRKISTEIARPKRRKKVPLYAPLREIDPNLPEEEKLKLVAKLSFDHELKTRLVKATAEQRKSFEDSIPIALDRVASQGVSKAAAQDERFKPNPANKHLELRERQLKAITRSYELELEQWESVKSEARDGTVSVVDIPDQAEPLDFGKVADVQEVLASSAKAVETYIIHTDHMRHILRQIESRSKQTGRQVRKIASKLNDRVLTDFGNASDVQLLPPPGLTKIETNDLNMAVLAED